MIPSRSYRCAGVLALLAVLCIVPAVSGIDAALGEVIPLQGYSSSSNYVYLFITGPNLPSNGVQLNDITQRADQGHFTKVPVDGDGHWSYKWGTNNVNGRLDAGTYTVWVVDSPADRSHLMNAEYRTLSVSLGKPAIAASVVGDTRTQQTGALEITSVPAGATVLLSGENRGKTPLSITGIPAGTYTLTFTLDGYHDLSTRTAVVAGMTSEVAANLVVREDTPAPETTTVLPETTLPAPSTVPATTKKSPLLLPVIVPAALALFLWQKGQKE